MQEDYAMDEDVLSETLTDDENRECDASQDDLATAESSDDAEVDPEDAESADRQRIIDALCEIFSSFIVQLTSCMKAMNGGPGGPPPSRIEIEIARRDGSGGFRTMSWPRRQNGLRDCARFFHVCVKCLEALKNNAPITKRGIFYDDVELFGRQSVVDNIVDDLAATLGISRSDLNVTASPKGLFCGSGIRLTLKSGSEVSPRPSEAILVPAGEEIAKMKIDKDFGWVLVVEKEAIFQTLCAGRLADSPFLSRRGLIITGKGQPDVATRKLCSLLSFNLPEHIPILMLVDGDPYGIEIASVYKFGAVRMKHEADNLTCPRAELVGLRASDLRQLGVAKESLLPASERDTKKSLELLRRDTSVMPASWKSDITYFLRLRRKAELEILSTLTFAQLPSPFPPHLNQNTRPELFDAWNATARGPLIIPYLITKLSTYLPPLN